jgi:hypothetical protein
MPWEPSMLTRSHILGHTHGATPGYWGPVAVGTSRVGITMPPDRAALPSLSHEKGRQNLRASGSGSDTGITTI